MNKWKLDNSLIFSSKKPTIKYSTTNLATPISLKNQKLYNINDFDAKFFCRWNWIQPSRYAWNN
jgi:hypothetical protein